MEIRKEGQFSVKSCYEALDHSCDKTTPCLRESLIPPSIAFCMWEVWLDKNHDTRQCEKERHSFGQQMLLVSQEELVNHQFLHCEKLGSYGVWCSTILVSQVPPDSVQHNLESQGNMEGEDKDFGKQYLIDGIVHYREGYFL